MPEKVGWCNENLINHLTDNKEGAGVASKRGKEDRSILILVYLLLSRICLIFWESWIGTSGLLIRVVPGLSTPLWVIILSVYPDMKTSFMVGKMISRLSASALPFMPGITTSVNRRSMWRPADLALAMASSRREAAWIAGRWVTLFSPILGRWPN